MTTIGTQMGHLGFGASILLGLLVYGALGQTPEGPRPGGPQPGTGPGPWNRDVYVLRVGPDRTPERLASFPRAGVPTAARIADGRLVAAFQHFPQGQPERFDKVAVAFSSDEGLSWSPPETVEFASLPEGMTRPFDPTLVPLPDGRLRMYFTSNRAHDLRRNPPAIYSAVSTNGVRFLHEPGIRFSIEGRVVIDCAVALHRGVFHLVVPDNGAPDDFFGGPHGDQAPTVGGGYHATSRDGLEFVREPDLKMGGRRNRWLGGLVSDGDRLLFFGTGPGPWPRRSVDGASWTDPDEPIRFRGADPGGVRLKDGTWLVVLTGPPVHLEQQTGDEPGRGGRGPVEER